MSIKTIEKSKRRERRKYRIRRKVFGTSEKPRVSVFKSDRYTYAQVIDDVKGVTIASVSTRNPEVVALAKESAGQVSAKSVSAALSAGRLLGAQLRDKGVTGGVYDRSGFLYTGRVKALADGMREAGIQI